MTKSLNIAVIGAGGFAQFATAEFVNVPNVKLVGVYDENPENASRLRSIDALVKVYDSIDALLADRAIDLIYIATPPYLHYTQSKSALLAGKHVICEKPAATKLEHAIELRELASHKNLLYVVNLMQRYNSLYDVVTQLIQDKVLGDFLHGFFENYASDEALTEQHWFWDEQKSGGIFIEHSVHFFDMFTGWLGEGKIVAAQKSNRKPHKNVWDRVQATAMFSDGLVNFYHGFDQPKAMDRQEMRLQFERGEITLYEWVPTRLKMTALCNEKELQKLKSLLPQASIEIVESHLKSKTTRGRFKEIKYNYKIALDTGVIIPKHNLYQQLITSMFKDQLAWINDKSHIRKISQDNAVGSLKLAEEAEFAAIKI